MRLSPKSVAAKLRRLCPLRPRLAILLGSGFQDVLDDFDVVERISYRHLPGLAVTGVAGHRGEVCFARANGTPVLFMSGRVHYYEGYTMEQVTSGVRVLAAFGIRDLLQTNAAGGINRRFRPGDLMVCSDHINLMGVNPLRGPAVSGISRFVDMTHAYSVNLRRLLQRSARQCAAKLRSGVYLAVPGPSYETPAEIRAFARLGADAVGMSTVPETIVARQYGLNVAALSCITNLAAGLSGRELSHTEVLETGGKVKALAAQLLKTFVKFYGRTYA
jgi:purine-nucleoside phosphorylase